MSTRTGSILNLNYLEKFFVDVSFCSTAGQGTLKATETTVEVTWSSKLRRGVHSAAHYIGKPSTDSKNKLDWTRSKKHCWGRMGQSNVKAEETEDLSEDTAGEVSEELEDRPLRDRGGSEGSATEEDSVVEQEDR